jgi:hypothetical protein
MSRVDHTAPPSNAGADHSRNSVLLFNFCSRSVHISLNAPTDIALIDRSIVLQLVRCALYLSMIASRGLEQKKSKTFGATTNLNTVGLFLFPNGYDLVQRSVEAASKSRGAATPTHFFAFSIENKSSWAITACFYCTHKRTACLLYYTHTFMCLCMCMCTIAAPGA